MDDTKFGQMTVKEPSGTFNAKSFMDGHILYILEKNEALDMGTVTLVYMNPKSELYALRSSIAGFDLGGGQMRVLPLTMKGFCTYQENSN